ncbi:regulator of Ty1 transposition [Scheffersomyces xylosifermentans]|uniref:regulator of Ty1 transposition n=1 Tax=Scheffersomyces xylosifermentans TaxID=1304137 RepID=UPI00315DD2A5
MQNLLTNLSKVLPNNDEFKVFYVQSKPTYIKSPVHFSSRDPNKPQTVKIRHFLQLIDHNDVVLLGIEIFIYIQLYKGSVEQFVFVSKCDTVGSTKTEFRVGEIFKVFLTWLIQRDISAYNIKQSISHKEENEKQTKIHNLESIVGKLNDPSYYSSIPYYNEVPTNLKKSHRQPLAIPEQLTTKLVLFTRAADQYLYPNSHKNKQKHILNGVQLLKWWIKVIDSTVTNEWICKLCTPGHPTQSTAKFIEGTKNSWEVGHLYTPTTNRAVYTVPLFPDDPKGRFLEHLIVENRYGDVSVQQFYEELGYRQEFLLGELVGLIGCQLQHKDPRPVETAATSEGLTLVTIQQYKQIINLLKGEDYTITSDVQLLVKVKIPELMRRNSISGTVYHKIKGTKVKSEAKRSAEAASIVVNTLAVKRRTKPKPTNLNHLVRKKK